MFNDIEKTAVLIRNAIRDIPKQFDYNQREEKRLDKETQDLLHLLELTKFNARDGYKIAAQLQQVRQARRHHKNENELLLDLNEAMKGMQDHLNELDRVVGYIRKTKDSQEKRTYKCRVRNDLQEQFEKVKEA